MREEEQIVEMYQQGFSGYQIGDALDMDPRRVYYVLEKHGVPRKYAGVREWRKLRKTLRGKGQHRTLRMLTLPRKYIEKAGFNPHAELEGKWEVQGRDLILHIREVGESAPSKSPTG